MLVNLCTSGQLISLRANKQVYVGPPWAYIQYVLLCLTRYPDLHALALPLDALVLSVCPHAAYLIAHRLGSWLSKQLSKHLLGLACRHFTATCPLKK